MSAHDTKKNQHKTLNSIVSMGIAGLILTSCGKGGSADSPVVDGASSRKVVARDESALGGMRLSCAAMDECPAVVAALLMHSDTGVSQGMCTSFLVSNESSDSSDIAATHSSCVPPELLHANALCSSRMQLYFPATKGFRAEKVDCKMILEVSSGSIPYVFFRLERPLRRGTLKLNRAETSLEDSLKALRIVNGGHELRNGAPLVDDQGRVQGLLSQELIVSGPKERFACMNSVIFPSRLPAPSICRKNYNISPPQVSLSSSSHSNLTEQQLIPELATKWMSDHGKIIRWRLEKVSGQENQFQPIPQCLEDPAGWIDDFKGLFGLTYPSQAQVVFQIPHFELRALHQETDGVRSEETAARFEFNPYSAVTWKFSDALLQADGRIVRPEPLFEGRLHICPKK